MYAFLATRTMRALLAAAAVAGLSGCLTGGGGGGKDAGGGSYFNDSAFSFSFEEEVLGIVPPQGSTPGKLITRSARYYCHDNEDRVIQGLAEERTSTDTTHYAIADGKLYLWQPGECDIDYVFTGVSGTIQGTWTANDWDYSRQPLPEGYRGSCNYDGEDYDEEEFDDDFPLPEDFSVVHTMTVSAGKAESRHEGRYCLARVETWYLTEFYSGLELVSSSCTSVEIRNVAANKVATFSSSLKDGKAVLNFSYNGSSCTFREPWGPIPAQTMCHVEFDGYNGSGYEDCVEESGFYEGVGFDWDDDWDDWSFEKRSAERAKKILPALNGLLPPRR